MKIMLSAIALVASVGTMHAHSASADNGFPSKPIRFVVPYPPGGANDTVARLIAQKIAENVRQFVVVDNKAGASGLIGAEFVAKSTPDGYTVMIHTDSLIASLLLNPNLKFNVRQDVSPVTHMVNMEYVLLVNSSVAARDLAELINLAKTRPGKLNYSSTGIGSSGHILTEAFKRAAGVNLVHVPYKGGGPATLAVIMNETQLIAISVSTSSPYVKAGKMRALAMLGFARSKAMPDVPILSEVGLGNFPTPWLGIFAPAKTPSPTIQRLNAEFVKVLNAPDIQEKLEAQGFGIVASTPGIFGKFIDDTSNFYGKLIRDLGIKAE